MLVQEQLSSFGGIIFFVGRIFVGTNVAVNQTGCSRGDANIAAVERNISLFDRFYFCPGQHQTRSKGILNVVVKPRPVVAGQCFHNSFIIAFNYY